MAKAKRPTPEERDERVKVDLDPEVFIGGVLAAGPHEDDTEDEPKTRSAQPKLG